MRNTLSFLPSLTRPYRTPSGRTASGIGILSLLLAACSFSYSYEGTKPVPMSPVNEWLYRSGQPTAAEFEKFHQKGIRTVVNFRDEPQWIEWERRGVEGLGMKYVSLPWSIVKSVKPELLDQLFEVLDNPANHPVLMHCKHGRDRTGVMTTLALMRYEKLSEAQAREQALETVRPNLRYRMFVNQKVDFFIKKKAFLISGSSGKGPETVESKPEEKPAPVAA